jgi:hypothetical protein
LKVTTDTVKIVNLNGKNEVTVENMTDDSVGMWCGRDLNFRSRR